MKKLVLTSEWKFHQVYQSRLTKYRVKREFVMLIEILFLVLLIMFCIAIFLIFVNQSSTQWYFLRQAKSTLSNTEFDYWIVKTQIVELNPSNRNRLEENNSSTRLWTNVEKILVDEPIIID